MTKPHACLWLVFLAILAFAIGTLPGAAHGEPLAPAPECKTEVRPDGTATLCIVPKLLPMKSGEEALVPPPPRPPRNPLVKEPLEWV